MTTTTKGYAIGYLNNVEVCDDVITYLERIDATLAPYGGRFIVHGGRLTPLEGEWGGDLIIIEFPGRSEAAEWYASPGYQEILPLRTDHAEGVVAVVEGAEPGHRGVDKVAEVLPG